MAVVWKFIVPSLLTILSSILPMTLSSPPLGNLDRCGGRLERALESLQRDSPRRNRLDEEEAGIVYQQKLVSVPLEMTVSRIMVKLPHDSRNHGGLWARVEKCAYEPNSNALQTRVMFNDLSVSGVISLLPRDYRASIPAETCRMSLRLRRAGIEFHTSPIARGRGQMRIRTESSFLEPRFASIYAYGCRPTRVDKQIKRYDKWAYPHHQQHPLPSATVTSSDEVYEGPEPREIAGLSKEEVLTIANESARGREIDDSDARLGIWRKNVWVTKIPRRRKRRRSENEAKTSLANGEISVPSNFTNSSTNLNSTLDEDPSRTLSKREANESAKNSTRSGTKIFDATLNSTREENSTKTSTKNGFKRETTLSQLLYYPLADRQMREFNDNNDFDQSMSDEDDLAGRNDDWQSREGISNEMEDIFLRGASQALTRYIERELHPAIKETLMLSMGYTISYG